MTVQFTLNALTYEIADNVDIGWPFLVDCADRDRAKDFRIAGGTITSQ